LADFQMNTLDVKAVLLLVFVIAGFSNCTSKSRGYSDARRRQSVASAAPSNVSSAQPNASTSQVSDSTPPVNDSAQCDPNYSPCVPIASDVDCAGGRGNGPAYVKGPVRVIGKDIYGLDKDHDGIGCER
jgi:hypothetical protein